MYTRDGAIEEAKVRLKRLGIFSICFDKAYEYKERLADKTEYEYLIQDLIADTMYWEDLWQD